MKIRYRLALSFAAVVAVSAAVTVVLSRPAAESLFRQLAFAGDAEKAKAYAGLLAEFHAERNGWAGVQDFLLGLPGLFSASADVGIHGAASGGTPPVSLAPFLSDRVVVADDRGVIVGDTASAVLGSFHPAAHLAHGIPVMSAGGARVGTVLVGSMVDSSLTGAEERYLSAVLAAVAWSAAAATACAVALGFLLASRFTKSIARLAAAAGEVAAGKRVDPVPAEGRDEVAELSRAFNAMAADVARLDEARRRLIADSAHELRTPLTLIRGAVEGMLDGVLPADRATLESVHEETLRLSRLVDTLRELEIIQSGQIELAIEGVDLARALSKAVGLFAAAAAERSLAIEYAGFAESSGPDAASDKAEARGDALRVGQVIYNLLDNAVKYAPAGGTVRVSLLPDDGTAVGFSVEDSGPGIPPELRERIFERFYRVDPSRSTASGGRGLGLAIVAEIVKAHGGTVSVGRSELGGARFTVTLPSFGARGTGHQA